jgi:hypothetical protein
MAAIVATEPYFQAFWLDIRLQLPIGQRDEFCDIIPQLTAMKGETKDQKEDAACCEVSRMRLIRGCLSAFPLQIDNSLITLFIMQS